MNNAATGGIERLLSGLLFFAAAALLWAVVQGVPIEPSTGPVITGLCFIGIVGYAGWLAVFSHDQNRHLVRTRNVLRRSEEQFRFIAEHAGDLVSVLTPEHRFRYASASHEKYFESAKFADGADWLELVHPEDSGQARAFLELLSKSPHSERVQLRIVPTGAPPRMVECQGNPVREEGGKLQMIVLLCRDQIDSGDTKVASLRGVPAAGSGAPNGTRS
jgi:PAS domain S-box-containing protein